MGEGELGRPLAAQRRQDGLSPFARGRAVAQRAVVAQNQRALEELGAETAVLSLGPAQRVERVEIRLAGVQHQP